MTALAAAVGVSVLLHALVAGVMFLKYWTERRAAGQSTGEGQAADVTRQGCFTHVRGFTDAEAATLRRNYLPLSDDERHELDWTFASIVDPNGVPE